MSGSAHTSCETVELVINMLTDFEFKPEHSKPDAKLHCPIFLSLLVCIV